MRHCGRKGRDPGTEAICTHTMHMPALYPSHMVGKGVHPLTGLMEMEKHKTAVEVRLIYLYTSTVLYQHKYNTVLHNLHVHMYSIRYSICVSIFCLNVSVANAV